MQLRQTANQTETGEAIYEFLLDDSEMEKLNDILNLSNDLFAEELLDEMEKVQSE